MVKKARNKTIIKIHILKVSFAMLRHLRFLIHQLPFILFYHFIPFLSQYHLIIPAFVSHVLIISADKPKAKIKNICLKESGKPVIIKKTGRTAAKAVNVIKIPVLKAEKI